MKVGSYVHWRYSNYLNCGLSVDKEQGSRANPQAIFGEQRTKLLNSLKSSKHDEATRKSLEDQINFFFNPMPATIQTGFSPAQMQQIQNYLDQLVNKTIQQLRPKALAKASYDRNTLRTFSTGGGSITLDDGSTESWAQIRRAKSFRDAGGTTTAYAVDRRIKQLLAERDKLSDLAEKSSADMSFIAKVNQFEKDWQLVKQDVAAITAYESSGGPLTKRYDYGSKTAGIRSGRYKISNEFANELQDLIDMTLQVTDTELKGILGEVVPVISQWAWSNFQNKEYAEIESMLSQLDTNVVVDLFTKKAGIGQQTSKKISLASKVIATGDVSGNQQVKLGKASLNTSYTQDKVDIALDLDSGEQINASVKNLNLSSGHDISLLKGTNVVNFIQDYPVFANHYLNVVGNDGRGSDKAPNTMINIAHDTIKLTIALHAFIGGLWSEDKQGNVGRTAEAELFIVNDTSSTERYKIYYISDLLQKVSENMNYIKLDIPKTYPNNWLGPKDNDLQSAWARVASMLAVLREQELKVSLDPAVLKT